MEHIEEYGEISQKDWDALTNPAYVPINPKDFRIGNYVYDPISTEWMVVDILQLNDQNEVNIGATLLDRDKYPLPPGWRMQPIPLTPELLEKCGFSKWKGCATWQFDLPLDESIQITKNEIFLAGNDAAVSGHGVHCKCDYLHQLQNLYFALTGEELNVQL